MKLNDDRAGRLILALRKQGVTDTRVLAAMESIDRAVFVHPHFLDQAWEDQALPIDCAQTISQPYIVGLMTQALQVGPRHRVLEIGTGSGYQCAVLSRMARFVYSVERYKSLLNEAENRLKILGIDSVFTRHGDGGQVGPAAPQRCDAVAGILDALEAGNHRNLAGLHALDQHGAVD